MYGPAPQGQNPTRFIHLQTPAYALYPRNYRLRCAVNRLPQDIMRSITLTETFHYTSQSYNYNIHWTSLGNASSPPLIFVHGTPWSSQVWHTYAQTFAKYFHVYLFDNPGFGISPLGQPSPPTQLVSPKKSRLDADLSQQSEVFAALY